MKTKSDDDFLLSLLTGDSTDSELKILRRESSKSIENLGVTVTEYYQAKVKGYEKARSDIEKYPFLKLFCGFLEGRDSSEIFYYMVGIEINDQFVDLLKQICSKKVFNLRKIFEVFRDPSKL